MTKKEILEIVEQEDVEFIRLQFTDMFGNLKNAAVTASQLAKALDNTYVFEGASFYDEFKPFEDDMYLYPDLDTFVMLPWRPQQGKVARLLCDVYLDDGKALDMSPRTILKRVIDKSKKEGYEFTIDPECEFFLFDSSEDGLPTTTTHETAGYMDVGPIDLGENARRDMVMSLEQMGFLIESSHHEKAPAQHKIIFRGADPLTIADSVVTFRSAVRSIARRFGLHASFMPKPLNGVAGSGMHMNITVHKDGKNIFYSENGEVSKEADYFMGGLLKHAKGMCAITNPIVNSYKRLHTGFGAPQEIAWTTNNQSVLLRLQKRATEDTKVKLRFPDAAANPYLTIAISIIAGMDGINNRISAGKSYTEQLQEGVQIAQMPSTLCEAIYEFKQDTLIQNALGKEFSKIYQEEKMTEWNEYKNEVSEWEIRKYLNRV